MASLGDDQADVGVLDVAQQVLVAPGVIETDDDRAGQRRAPEGEEVLGGVVEQHTDVQHAVGRARSLCEKEVGPPDRLREVLGVRPRAIFEMDRGPRRRRAVRTVAAQQRGRVRRPEA